MNQHYVPKFIIEGFVDERSAGNRGVWVYHSKYRTWQKRPTKRTASLDDFYSLIEPSGEREDAIENFLHGFETPVALLLQKDITPRHPIGGAPHRDDIFIAFCAFLFARNPVTVDSARRTLVREAQKLIEESTASDEAFQRFRADVHAGTGQVFPNLVEFKRLRTDFKVDATKAGALATAIATSQYWRDRLPRMYVDFVFAPPNSAGFITADVPYAWIMKETAPDELDQVIIPLSSSVTAIFESDAEPGYGYSDLTPAESRAVNLAILSGADQFIISSSQAVFDKVLLDEWAVGDRDARLAPMALS